MMRIKRTNNVVGSKDESTGSVGSLEDEWDLGSEENTGFDSPYVEMRIRGGSGTLILSGDEDSSHGAHRRDGVANMFLTAADLSFPGTDSLPSDIDSIDVSGAGESAMSGSNQQIAPPGALRRWRVSKSHLVPFLIVTSTVTTLLSGFLAWERHSWRTSALRLEEELHRLRADMKANQEDPPLCGSSDFDWEDSCRQPAHQKIVLADNCWLRAEAALTFGSCADNMRSNAKAFLGAISSVGGAMWSAVSSVHMKEVSYAEEFLNFTDGRPQTAGVTLDDVVEATSSIASATVAAGDAVMTAVSGVSGFMDEYISIVVNATRDAIEDGSFLLHLD